MYFLASGVNSTIRYRESYSIEERKWKNHSPELIDLIKQCLKDDPHQRPKALKLLNHRFFRVLESPTKRSFR